MHNILIVDDEAAIRQSLKGVLEDEGYKVSLAESGEACLEALKKRPTDVVLLDIWLPGIDGLETLEKIKEAKDSENIPEVIMISGHGTIETAVRATKLGAFDFIEKPLSLEKTLILVKHAAETKKLRGENRDLKRQLQPKSAIVGESIPMKALRQQIALMAPTNGRVLIYGESGSGKELAALAIHSESLRKDSMFVEVNCAAIPEDLIESELFGHRKGSFPGALNDKEGKFHKADGGTLFLDEVGDMQLSLQAKLLRVLQEQEIEPLGANRLIRIDVRVIAATSLDLTARVADGRFRADLFYRLNVLELAVPPLRMRLEDLPMLTERIMDDIGIRIGQPVELDDGALLALARHSWPGNVRELRNVLERAVMMNESPRLTADQVARALPLDAVVRCAAKQTASEEVSTLRRVIAEAERRAILAALSATHGNKLAAAQALGISRAALYQKLSALGLANAGEA